MGLVQSPCMGVWSLRPMLGITQVWIIQLGITCFDWSQVHTK